MLEKRFFVNQKESMVYAKNQKTGDIFRVISLRKLKSLVEDSEVMDAVKSWKPKTPEGVAGTSKTSIADEIEKLVKLGFSKEDALSIIQG